jgi:hypothetical protein
MLAMVVGEHPPPNICGWEGSLTTKKDCKSAAGTDTDFWSAGMKTPTESNPSEREWRADLNLIWLVHEGFWAK